MEPRQLHEYLSRVMYNRRNKMDPLWNSLVVGGVGINADTGDVEPYIGSVGMIGTHFSSSHIATGFGQHLARPLFRNEQSDDMSEADAEALIKKALKVCFYRDKNSINKFTLKVVTKDGIQTKVRHCTSPRFPFLLSVSFTFRRCPRGAPNISTAGRRRLTCRRSSLATITAGPFLRRDGMEPQGVLESDQGQRRWLVGRDACVCAPIVTNVRKNYNHSRTDMFIIAGTAQAILTFCNLCSVSASSPREPLSAAVPWPSLAPSTFADAPPTGSKSFSRNASLPLR